MEHIHATPVFGTMGWFISRNLVHDDSVTLFSPESYLPPTLQKKNEEKSYAVLSSISQDQ